tara:strand:+ start:8276 stop:10267 length:1992 start_codon:yes stop_codon:yes gene_type:complete
MVKWGILGTGMIARAFASSIKDSQNSELKYVASRSKESSNKFAEKYNCEAIEGYDSLIDLEDFEALYIATPHPQHFEFALRALQKGKAVLCEKPMTMNSTESMILIEAARKNNSLFMEAFMYRVHPQTEKIREIIKDYFLDEPLEIEASFGFKADVPKEHRLVNPELGGGSILDIGCYPMSMSRMVVGIQEGKSFTNPTNLKSKGTLSENNVDLFAEAKLEFSNGSSAQISSSINQILPNKVIIKNQRTTLEVIEPWRCGEDVGRKSSIFLSHEGKKEEIQFNEPIGIFTFEIDHFSEVLLSGSIESNLVSHSDSHGNMIWLDTWRKSIGVYYSEDKPTKREKQMGSFFEDKKSMPTSRIKGIDKELSRVVFGCDNQSDTNHAFAMFDYYFNKGGNVYDTAYIYNNGKSDRYLGDWIKARNNRDEVVILGKGAHTPDCLPEKIRPQLEETLDRLSTNKLDIYCLHRDNPEIPIAEFMDSLNELRDEGLIDVLGASNWSLDRFKEANEYSNSKNISGFGVLSNNFSLARMLEPVWPGCFSCSEEDYRQYLIDNQIAIFPWSSQARGFFLKTQEFEGAMHVANPNLQEQNRVWSDENNLERRQRCFELAEKKGFEPIEVALAFVLNQSFPTFPLIGPRNFFETESSLKAFDINLSNEEVAWLDLN